MTWVLVGIGGALGSLCRFSLGHHISTKYQHSFPFGTFLINITGALALGFIVGIDPPKSSMLLLADGFLGAYTTFSTFMYEGYSLTKEHMPAVGMVYLAGSVATGVLGYIIGFTMGGAL